MMIRKILTLVAIFFLVKAFAFAQENSKKQEKVQVRIHFQMNVFGVERLKQSSDLAKHLVKNGFDDSFDSLFEKIQNKNGNYIDGKASQGKERSLLHPQWVYSVISWPENLEKGLQNDQPARIEISFPKFMQGKNQKDFWGNLKKIASNNGFVDGTGYDHEDYTRLTGNALPSKLIDLDQKAIPEALIASGAQFPQNSYPRILKIRSDWPLVQLPESFRPKDQIQAKLSTFGRFFLESESKGLNRWVVVFAQNPPTPWMMQDFNSHLNEAEIEGAMGAAIQIKSSHDTLKKFLNLPYVMCAFPVSDAWKNISTKRSSEKLIPFYFHEGIVHKELDYKGKSSPPAIGVIGNNFSGWEKVFVEESSRVRYLDLTMARNPELVPDALVEKLFPNVSKQAFKVSRDYPGSEVYLIRVDLNSPLMMEEIAGFSVGNLRASASLLARYDEIEASRRNLDSENAVLQQERSFLIDQFGETDELVKRRKEFQERKEGWNLANRQLHQKTVSLLAIADLVKKLSSVRLFLLLDEPGTLLPMAFNSTVSLYSNDMLFRKNPWLISEGKVPEKYWFGPFKDANENGWMEFNSQSSQLWENEILPLRMDPKSNPLSQGQVFNIRIRWSEVADMLTRSDENGSWISKTNLNLFLLKKVMPLNGRSKQDEFLPLIETGEKPYCLLRDGNRIIFEQQIVFNVKEAGEFYLAIKGKVEQRKNLSPLDAHRVGEIRPEIFVEKLMINSN